MGSVLRFSDSLPRSGVSLISFVIAVLASAPISLIVATNTTYMGLHPFLSPAPSRRSGGYGNAGRSSVSPPVRPRYVVSALRFLFVDQLISNLHTSIMLGIASLSLKLGKIRKQFVRMAAIFKMSAKIHQHFKVLQFQRKLIFRRFSTWGMW